MFWKNFYFLCEQKNMKPLQVVKEIGIAHGNITNWKKGKLPSGTNLQKIADYFGVTVDSLLADTPEPTITNQLDPGNVHMIPLYEKVSAGFGALAMDEIIDYIPLYFEDPTEARDTICIRVTGDSMAPKIENGDIVQVHKQPNVESGNIAVVLLDGEEGLVKGLLYDKNWLELRSINPFYKPMRFNKSEMNRVRVVGLVTKLIKNVTGKVVPLEAPDSENKRALLALADELTDADLEELIKYADYLTAKKLKENG